MDTSNRQPPTLMNRSSNYKSQKQPLTQPLASEMKPVECTLCTTPTKFKDYHKLEKHVKKSHSDWNEQDSKRKKGGKEEVFPKKGKWKW